MPFSLPLLLLIVPPSIQSFLAHQPFIKCLIINMINYICKLSIWPLTSVLSFPYSVWTSTRSADNDRCGPSEVDCPPLHQ